MRGIQIERVLAYRQRGVSDLHRFAVLPQLDRDRSNRCAIRAKQGKRGGVDRVRIEGFGEIEGEGAEGLANRFGIGDILVEQLRRNGVAHQLHRNRGRGRDVAAGVGGADLQCHLIGTIGRNARHDRR